MEPGEEEWDPGGDTGDQLTDFSKAALPASWLDLPSPWRRENQGGCKDVIWFGRWSIYFYLSKGDKGNSWERGAKVNPFPSAEGLDCREGAAVREIGEPPPPPPPQHRRRVAGQLYRQPWNLRGALHDQQARSQDPKERDVLREITRRAKD